MGRSHQEEQESKNERSCPVKASNREVATGYNHLVQKKMNAEVD